MTCDTGAYLASIEPERWAAYMKRLQEEHGRKQALDRIAAAVAKDKADPPKADIDTERQGIEERLARELREADDKLEPYR